MIRVDLKLNSTEVVDAPTDLFILRRAPGYIRSDNGYYESFNARFRDELLNGEIFHSLREAQILIERW